MTDWHWFDWYNRPGVVSREGNNNCCAGDVGKAQARNKEEIQYKLMSGDASGLTDDEREKFWLSKDKLIGRLIEIRADAITQSLEGEHYSLRFPRFKNFRGFKKDEKI